MTFSPDTAQTIFADFFDGETARSRRVKVIVEGQANSASLQIFLPEGGQTIWPVRDVREIPDQAAKDSVVFGLEGDHPARLIVRDKELNDQLQLACPHLRRINKTPHLMRRLITTSVAAVTSVALIVFVLVPLMADQMATMLPTKGEQAFGDQTYDQIRQALGKDGDTPVWECNGPKGRAALTKMADRLKTGAHIPYDLRLHVLKHKMINAFALPGGHIILFDGLLKDAKSPEEVAGVLGHEMGHVEHRDPTRLALRSAGSVGVLGLLLGDFAGGAAVLFLTERLIQAQYSRGAEAGADTYSHALLAAADLPTGPMADFFDRLHKKYGGEQGLISHLASHPDSLGRSQAARAANTVGADFTPVLTADEWRDLKNICAQ